ncbi:unnamed protein product [Schistosoma mattheei]|uniref:Uncharacterized protein n=1 Tax=Schistosoma mattheei TaxID=31246 RepID=A0A183Q403_9TREM|nr:unnamed protein product [Schistosoma mattheei]
MSDSIETHNLEDLSPVEIDTVMTTKSRLPEFDRSDPELWFAQLEHYFTRQHTINTPKRGDLSKCENYRITTLLSVRGKVFNRVLLNRMEDSADIQLPDRQAGFREDRSCADQITILRITVEQSTEGNSSLYIDLIDHEKAFDIVDGLSRTVFGDK